MEGKRVERVAQKDEWNQIRLPMEGWAGCTAIWSEIWTVTGERVRVRTAGSTDPQLQRSSSRG